MKKTIIVIALVLFAIGAKGQSKRDTTAYGKHYTILDSVYRKKQIQYFCIDSATMRTTWLTKKK